jgi:hypothetical protein
VCSFKLGKQYTYSGGRSLEQLKEFALTGHESAPSVAIPAPVSAMYAQGTSPLPARPG